MRYLPLLLLLAGCGWSEYDQYVAENQAICNTYPTYTEQIACHRNVYVGADQVGNHPASYVHKLALSQLYFIAEQADREQWPKAKWNAHADAVVAATNQTEYQIKMAMARGLQYDIQQAQKTFAGFLSIDQRFDNNSIITDRYYY